MFNTAALDASAILQGRQALKDEVAKKTAEWVPKMDASLIEKFSHAMARFIIASENADTPEKVVDLVEQFRRYSPFFKTQDWLDFDKQRRAFSQHLMVVGNAHIGVPKAGEVAVNNYYMNKAVEYRGKVAHAGLKMDQVEFERTLGAWNKIAEEWRLKLEALRKEKKQ
jgi:hypothetical protein